MAGEPVVSLGLAPSPLWGHQTAAQVVLCASGERSQVRRPT